MHLELIGAVDAIPQRLTALLGLGCFMLMAWAWSSNRRKVPWRIVLGGLSLQFVFALLVFHTAPGDWLLAGIDYGFGLLSQSVEQGSSFVFKWNDEDGSPNTNLLKTFAFGVLPTVIVFASIMSVLYHVGVMSWVVKGIAWVMQRTLRTSGAESLAAAANVFVGHTEAPLVVRPFIKGMTRSELNAMMVGGFATITGALIPAFESMGVSASHLVTASVISAPAALLIAKLMEPETETPETYGTLQASITRSHTNLWEAAAVGASDGLKLALNIGAMLIAFLALIALANLILAGIGNECASLANRLISPEKPLAFDWSIEGTLSYLFGGFAFLMGIEPGDCLKSGELLGLKVVANELVAYEGLQQWGAQTEGNLMSERTKVIMTYALAGFTNFAAIGIQIGGIGGLVPERRQDLAKLGLRAMFGGFLACCMTACIAGILY